MFSPHYEKDRKDYILFSWLCHSAEIIEAHRLVAEIGLFEAREAPVKKRGGRGRERISKINYFNLYTKLLKFLETWGALVAFPCAVDTTIV